MYAYFVHMYFYASCVYLVLEEKGRGCQIPWNWSDGWL